MLRRNNRRNRGAAAAGQPEPLGRAGHRLGPAALPGAARGRPRVIIIIISITIVSVIIIISSSSRSSIIIIIITPGGGAPVEFVALPKDRIRLKIRERLN